MTTVVQQYQLYLKGLALRHTKGNRELASLPSRGRGTPNHSTQMKTEKGRGPACVSSSVTTVVEPQTFFTNGEKFLFIFLRYFWGLFAFIR